MTNNDRDSEIIKNREQEAEKSVLGSTATAFFDKQRNEIAKGNAALLENDDQASEPTLSGIETNRQNDDLHENQSAQGLPADAKRALVSLMRMGAVVINQKPKLFEQICRYEKLIQQHLSNMYLRLLLDAKAGVALVLQQEVIGDGEDDIYTLISRRTLSLYDTLLLLILRKFYQQREASGEQRVIVDVDQIETGLTPFLPLTNSARSDRRTLNASLKKMTERKILSSIRAEEGRYEITPVIRYVVNAAYLERLLNEYVNLANESVISNSDEFEIETQLVVNDEKPSNE